MELATFDLGLRMMLARQQIPDGLPDAARRNLAPIAIGLALTLIHLISIPVTNTSVNPARSTGVALFADTAAVSQLWLFWLAPLIGGLLGAAIWRYILSPGESLEDIGGE